MNTVSAVSAMPGYRVALFFRKKRASANFSMETSFESMMENFPRDSDFALDRVVSSYLSNGIVPRVRAIFEARRHAADVNHVTGEVHFLALGLPGDRTIVTVHDCGFVTRARNPLKRNLLKWFWLDLPVRHCRYVTVVSEATRQEVLHYTNCPPEKVRVIPTVIAQTFRRCDRPFDVEDPRILHIGLAPNKNFERHVKAISGLRCRLHVIGKLREAHIQLLEGHGVRYTSEHEISREEVYRAYCESDLVLFASTMEGFGMPILEAQAVGRPVVTSNTSSMPEVAGDGACLVDPHSVDSIRAGIERIIGDPGYRAALVEAGYRNTARFRADAVAKQYEALYRQVISACEPALWIP